MERNVGKGAQARVGQEAAAKGRRVIAPLGRHSLPAPSSSFVGREREIADLTELLESGRLVTLTGPGGSGKSRLALEVGARLSARYPNGPWFVDLSPLRDARPVIPAIAAALAIQKERSRPLRDTLVDRLRETPLLLILDNLEQIPQVAPIVADLLARCGQLHVIGTSRSPLYLRGEQEYPVGPLRLPEPADLSWLERIERTEAVLLFLERARAIDPLFALTAQNSSAIIEICRRLDGLPLAIELAAARTRILSPRSLVERLERRLPLLTTGAADAPARQRTLRETIAWSYDLFGPVDRAVFVRLSVFSGGFTLRAAEAVVPDGQQITDGDVLDAIDRLVAHNLVRVGRDAEDEPRFRLLETVGEFAGDLLPAADLATLRARHAAHFADRADVAAREIGGLDSATWVGRLTDDIDNVRDALEWARDHNEADLLLRLVVGVSEYLAEHLDHTEADRWLHAAEAVASTAEPSLRAAFLYELADFEIAHGGNRVRVEQLFTEALRIWEDLGDGAGMARVLAVLGAIAMDRGDRQTAATRIRKARTLSRLVGDPVEAAQLVGDITIVSMAVLDAEESRELATRLVEVGTETGSRHLVAQGTGCLGLVAQMKGDLDDAIAKLSGCSRMLAEVGTMPGQSWALSSLALAYVQRGDLEAARPVLREGAARARDLDWVFIGLTALEGAAYWLGAAGEPHRAVVCWAAVDGIRSKTLDRTFGHDAGLFVTARNQDRAALRPVAFENGRAEGAAMSLRVALDYAIRAIDETVVPAITAARAPSERGRYELTAREREVLNLLAAGRSDSQIAEALFISKKTASVHVANIKGKLGVGSRVQIVTTALRLGLAEAPD